MKLKMFRYSRLDLVSETEYVELMKTRLDPDSLGIYLSRENDM